MRAFTSDDAPIFFGRRGETDGLVQQLANPDTRFIMVVGASGSGKSSLVAAGLIPRLQGGALEGSRDWDWVRFTPGGAGDNPFRALAEALVTKLTHGERRAYDLECQLRAGSEALASLTETVLRNRPAWAELLLFIDQFEELFTVVAPTQREPFIHLLDIAAQSRRLRLVATVRADFYARCVEFPALAERLRTGSYPLAAPGIGALFEMITGPAGRAGLGFEEGLVTRLLEDTGSEPGALALLAFALHELYEQRTQEGLLTHVAYDSFNGVQGAIVQRAETIFTSIPNATQQVLVEVFQELVKVDEQGLTRKRAWRKRVSKSAGAAQLVDALIAARLLVASQDGENQAIIEVAHEALLMNWPKLRKWIEENQEDLHLLSLLRRDAAELGPKPSKRWNIAGLTSV